MRQRAAWVLMAGGLLLLVASGCASLFPSSHTNTKSAWKSYAEVNAAFAKIIPYHTKTNELTALGFDSAISPNVHILTYVDIMRRFMPNPAITKADLPPAVREFVKGREKSLAYEIVLSDVHSKRHGNLFLDIFGFKRRTTETGWEFTGLVLVTDGMVVYKISSGEPKIGRENDATKPLGPFQELDSVLLHAATH